MSLGYLLCVYQDSNMYTVTSGLALAPPPLTLHCHVLSRLLSNLSVLLSTATHTNLYIQICRIPSISPLVFTYFNFSVHCSVSCLLLSFVAGCLADLRANLVIISIYHFILKYEIQRKHTFMIDIHSPY